ncbi:MAG: hypothetical protein IJO91_10095 [Oscillospiraceae bacterium]|nr:hypothetical protein [Oscillospiraceae bacterium]
MARNYKLDSKNKIKNKDTADGMFTVNTGFFKRYVVSRQAGVVIMILEVLSLVLTSIFALCLGVLGALSTMSQGFDGMVSSVQGYIQTAVTLWMVSSVVYVIGTIVLFLGFSRIASAIHGVAMVMTIVMYALFRIANDNLGIDGNAGPAMLYMPCIFITLISVAVAMIVYIPRWLDKRIERENSKAPSILAEEKED